MLPRPLDLLTLLLALLLALDVAGRVDSKRVDLEEFENIEHDLAVWKAVRESLKDWRERRERKLRQQQQQTRPERERPPADVKVRRRRDGQSVCYEPLGCYEGVFDYLDTLPAPPDVINTTFLLYTRKNPTEAQVLDYKNQSSVLNSNFNASAEVKVIIHGFGSSSRRPWVLQMTEALLNLDDFNVINVDWENGSRMPNYVQAAANTQLVGKQLAELIRTIGAVTSTPPSRYHLIGFSLGAHVAGFAGSEVANVSRITGLDPASPLFEGYPPDVRLDPSDADFVDVIHSNGDSFIKGGMGSFSPMGHVDFYPNGGRVQVGCNSVLMGAISDLIHRKWNSLCNHRRAFRFFIDSMSPGCTFRSFACDSYENYIKGLCFTCGADGSKCSNMGYWAHRAPGRGNMYLITREQEPFCANDYRLRLESSAEGQGTSWGRVQVALMTADGANETFVMNSDSEELKEGGVLQTLVVAHPDMLNVSHVQITYHKYKGWIYNGKTEWPIERFELLNSQGQIKSYCSHSTKLLTGQSLLLPLSPGNCSTPTDDNGPIQQQIENNEVSLVAANPVHVIPNRANFLNRGSADSPEDLSAQNQILSEHPPPDAGHSANSGLGSVSNMFWKLIGLDTTTTPTPVLDATEGANQTFILPVYELTTERSEKSNDKEESLFRSGENEEVNSNSDSVDSIVPAVSKPRTSKLKSAKQSLKASLGAFGRLPSAAIVGLIRTSRASKHSESGGSSNTNSPYVVSPRWTERASNYVRNRTAQFFLKWVHFPSHKTQQTEQEQNSLSQSGTEEGLSESALSPSVVALPAPPVAGYWVFSVPNGALLLEANPPSSVGPTEPYRPSEAQLPPLAVPVMHHGANLHFLPHSTRNSPTFAHPSYYDSYSN